MRFVFVMVLALAFAGQAFAQATLQITAAALPGGVVGASYPSQVLQATGGTAPYGAAGSTCTPPVGSRWCLDSSSGPLPPGLALSIDGGIISGVPTTAGTFSFVVRLTDSGTPLTTQQSAIRAFSIVVTDPLQITTATLPAATLNQPYAQQTLSTSGGTLPNSWTTISGALPQGMGLGASSGTISGTPINLSGRFSFTVRAVDSSNPQQSTTANLFIDVPPLITTATLPNGAVGLAYQQQTLTASPSVPPYTWTVSGGALPGGLTLTGAGVLDGVPTSAGTFNFTVSVTDSSATPLTGSKPFTIVVQSALSITTPSPLPTGAVGVFYQQQLTASGPSGPSGPLPVSWSVVLGNLPNGVNLSTSGVLTGFPTVPLTFQFTAQASAGNPVQTVQQNYFVTINQALAMSTTVLQPVTKGVAFSVQLAATGGLPPYSWSSQTPLPTGVNLSSSGILSGTSQNTGSFTLSIQVADTSTATPISRNLVLNVVNVLTVATTTLPDGEAGKLYPNFALTTQAGTPSFTWSLQAGSSLPAGLSLLSDGTLTGTPGPTTAGTYDFTVVVTDSSTPTVQTATKALTLKIHPPLQITTSTLLPTGVVNVFYQKQIDVTSGQTTLAWSTLGGLPPGILLSPTSGLLSGRPTQLGTFDFRITVDGTSPVQTASKDFRIIVNDILTITTPTSLPDAFLGADYSQTLRATGGLPSGGSSLYTWTNPDGGLPSWLGLSSGGVLSGRPTGVGTFSFLIQADDSFTPTQTASRTFTLRVNSAMAITTDSLPHAIQNIAYSQQLQQTGGTGPFTWVASGTLPAGLTFNTSGLLSGMPTTAESTSVTITVTDSRGISVAKNFTITVDPPVPALSAPNLPSTINPATTGNVAFVLASPFPSPLSGSLVLTFTSKAEVPGDDPLTRFSNGTRSVSFTIPANSTAAVFDTPVSLTASNVAGTIRLAANFNNGPQDVTVATTEIVSTAPKIISVVALRTGNGLQVQVTGYSPARRIISADFTFDLNVAGTISHPTVSANVGTNFATWFSSPASILQFGSGFSYVQSFDYAGGNVNDVQSVTVRLTNAQGSTSSQVISFK